MLADGRFLAAATAVIFITALPSEGTVVPRLDLPELTRSSGLIVQGRVIRHWSEWDSAHRFIWTHFEVQVVDALKGAPGKTVTISEPGGAVGQESLHIAGAPRYADREEVIVFLRQTPLGYWRANGWGQGRYTVTGPAGGVRHIRSNVEGLAFASPAGPRQPGVARRKALPLDRLNGMPLAQFKALVRSEVAGSGVTR